MKRAMLLTAVACAVVFALPAVASANAWHIDKAVAFSGSGGEGTLVGSTTIACKTTTVTGAYETTTTGWIEYITHGCTGPFGVHCNTTGQPTGTITTTKLTFHNAVLGGKPGILITPNAETKALSHFSCFGIPATVHGSGVLGTLNKNCGDTSSTVTIDFNVVGGAQEHTEWTGTKYGLTSTSGGGSSVASTDDVSRTIEFAGGAARTIDCAPATVWHVDKASSFSGLGGTGTFVGATTYTCATTTVAGAYETTTTGWIEYTTHGCTGPFGTHCNTTGQPTGTISTTKLAFHNAVLNGKPGILVTPNAETGAFAHFSCFGVPTTIHGNGILGTVTNRSCGQKSATTVIDFNVVGGKQEHTTWTGTTYGLTSTAGGGSSVATIEDASREIEVAGGAEQTINCTS